MPVTRAKSNPLHSLPENLMVAYLFIKFTDFFMITVYGEAPKGKEKCRTIPPFFPLFLKFLDPWILQVYSPKSS